MMSTFSGLTRYASVRTHYSEESIWRDAMGGAEPLRVFVCDGPLDAPAHIPTGAHSGSAGRGIGNTTERDPIWWR
jgi:hypothetical protein